MMLYRRGTAIWLALRRILRGRRRQGVWCNRGYGQPSAGTQVGHIAFLVSGSCIRAPEELTRNIGSLRRDISLRPLLRSMYVLGGKVVELMESLDNRAYPPEDSIPVPHLNAPHVPLIQLACRRRKWKGIRFPVPHSDQLVRAPWDYPPGEGARSRHGTPPTRSMVVKIAWSHRPTSRKGKAMG